MSNMYIHLYNATKLITLLLVSSVMIKPAFTCSKLTIKTSEPRR